jgi:23S rRNA (uracil1939-C5)-methyltransferase
MAKQRRKRKRPPQQDRQRQRPAGKTITLDIRDMAHGGSGLGFYQGRPVFVPYTLPGESITAEITGGRGRVQFARGLRLHGASADRSAPRCPHFGPGRCWGCQWQHINYDAQLLLKQDVLADQLARVGGLPDSLIESALQPILPTPQPWAYNHSLSLLRAASGDWGLKRQARGIEAIGECHLAHPDLLELLQELDLDYERAERMTLRRGSDGRMMLIFEIDAEEEPNLNTNLPLSVNLILPDREPINLIGDAHSNFAIARRHFRVTAGAYMRPNIGALNSLIAAVMRLAQLPGSARVLDLYAGVGVFSAFLANEARLVTVVESYPPAANDADANLRLFDNVDVIEGAVEAVLADMIAEEAQYDVALVDPPGSGLRADVAQGIAMLGVGRLVYVSGNPASLARDSRSLVDAGYDLRAIQPIDLAPQTYYIDAVALFER